MKSGAAARSGAVIFVAAFAVAATRSVAQPAGPVSAVDYTAAAKLLETNLAGLVKNATVEPHWIGGGDFWYVRDDADGVRYVRFDRKRGTRRPLFDHEALASALGRALPDLPAPTAARLGITGVALTTDLRQLTGQAGVKAVRCDLVAMRCEAVGKDAAPPMVFSPDGKRGVWVRDYNLVVRDIATGRDSALTADGAEAFAWASLPESSLLTIPRKKGLLSLPPVGAAWSPDGRFLLASKTDERQALVNPFVEWVPADGSLRPIYYPVRSPFTGDRGQLSSGTSVFDFVTGASVRIALPARFEEQNRFTLSPDPLGWSVGRRQVFLLGRSYGNQTAVVFRVDLGTGQAAVVMEESSPTRVETNTEEYNLPNIRLIGDGVELIWYSARSGSGQLYRYDAQTGQLLNPITEAPGAVFGIIAVDEKRREVYYTAGGREPGRDPYLHHLYKASLDRGGARLLTEADGDHSFPTPPPPLIKLLLRRGEPASRVDLADQVFIDTWSTVGTPPVTVLRSTIDGRLLHEVERADPTALFAAGWRPPVREKVKAADGTTDLWAVYYQPLRGTLGNASHPVIDAVYGGPQVIVAPKNFVEAYSAGNPLGENGLARLGFALVTVDGRGTPYRDNAFRDAGYPEFTQVAIDDHIAAIKQLAGRHPEMDVSRVGIYGWSWGGTFTAQAMLSRPEFYRVGVTGAGVYNYAALYPGFENFTGIPKYADGSSERTKPNDTPGNWKPLDITALAPNLAGRMLIVYGDLDENVPPSQAFRLVAALVKANKPYDLLYLPGRTHGGAVDPYTIQRTWDYFVEHLLKQDPPADAAVVVGRPR